MKKKVIDEEKLKEELEIGDLVISGCAINYPSS